MKFKILSTLIFTILNIYTLQAQKLVPVSDVDELKQYDIILEEKYPSFFDDKTVTGVYEIDSDYSRIVYDDNGVETEELVFKRGLSRVIVVKSVVISPDDVPRIVKNGIQETHPSVSEANKYLEVSPAFGGSKLYAVEFEKEDKIQRFYFNSKGRQVEAPR